MNEREPGDLSRFRDWVSGMGGDAHGPMDG